jgi:hypothetical protein
LKKNNRTKFSKVNHGFFGSLIFAGLFGLLYLFGKGESILFFLLFLLGAIFRIIVGRKPSHPTQMKLTILISAYVLSTANVDAKKVYHPIEVYTGSADTIDVGYIERVGINLDSSIQISRSDFDQRINWVTHLLREKSLHEINDEQHIEIMKCLNTLMMRDLDDARYDEFNQAVVDTKYVTDIVKVYPNWIPNRGMGFYFPNLQMELYGTPRLYAYYDLLN